jgi:diguanylate cyclase (GGDEF)-like protein/PAS domain S-box-containing protein
VLSPEAREIGLDHESLFNLSPSGTVVTRVDGTVLEVNDTVVAWTGIERASLIGRSFPRMLPVGDRILYSTHVLPQLGLGQAVTEMAVQLSVTDGTRRPMLLSVHRVAVIASAHESEQGRDAPQVDVITLFPVHDRSRDAGAVQSAVHRAEKSEAERVRAQASLERAALHDPLTGLLNGAGIDRRLTLPDARQGRATVYVVNLDHFRAVNESLGHAAGEELLQEMARRLVMLVDGGGAAGRLSGDGFVIVDTHPGPLSAPAGGSASVPTVDERASRILDAVASPVELEGLEIVVTASIGVAIAEADPASGAPWDARALIHDADVAMFQAKAAGRNTWRRYEPSSNHSAVGRLRLLGELRSALEHDEFRLIFQPQLDLARGTTHGAEALVRWKHPVRGVLGPDEFIDLAEESGFIVALGSWVLEEAVREAARWRATGADGVPPNVSVNVSARQLSAPGLIDTVTAALETHSLDPARLTIEVTETALLSDAVDAGRILGRLRSMGVRISIDDFGTGHAGFSYLKLFPVDELKIDRSFVAGIGTPSNDAAIVSSCIQLAHALAIEVVAEGVETALQRTALEDLGCDIVQGYLVARPAEPARLGRWIARDPPEDAAG